VRSWAGLRRPKTLCIVVFASDHPDVFLARYDLSDASPVAFAPTESGVTSFIASMLRMNGANPITIACIRTAPGVG